MTTGFKTVVTTYCFILLLSFNKLRILKRIPSVANPTDGWNYILKRISEKSDLGKLADILQKM